MCFITNLPTITGTAAADQQAVRMMVDVVYAGISRCSAKTGFQTGIAQAVGIGILLFKGAAQSMALSVGHRGNQVTGNLDKTTLHRTKENLVGEGNDDSTGTTAILKNKIGNGFEFGAALNLLHGLKLAFGFNGGDNNGDYDDSDEKCDDGTYKTHTDTLFLY